jgi:hypothetical protein
MGATLMASFYKWYPAAEDSVVPWNARYGYPGQALPAVKTTPRISPKNGSDFSPSSVIRLEFPAQGYLNPRNTTLAFDVVLNPGSGGTTPYARFQNNIQSIFSRVRLMYGSTPLEDIIDYNVITRCLTEWTAPGVADQLSINDGIAYNTVMSQSNAAGVFRPTVVNGRQAIIQGVDNTGTGSATDNTGGTVPTNTGQINAAGAFPVRRYTVQLNLGLLNQDKLIPIKFMASQLAIEITLAQPEACILCRNNGAAFSGSGTTYQVQNVTLLPEILEFDAAYDAMFLKGLKEGGVPIKFQTWHTFNFGLQAQTSVNVQIQERSRSVKSIFVVQRIGPDALSTDSGATLYHSNNSGTLQQYQFRIGGRYYPASPVQCATTNNSAISNGAAEAYAELGKALHTLGDYRLSTALNSARWGYPVNPATDAALDSEKLFNGLNTGVVTLVAKTGSGNLGGGQYSHAFAMATSLETTDGAEISGLNAEEQSDIILQAQWSSTQSSGYILEAFTYFDAMLIIRENNVVELIQ